MYTDKFWKNSMTGLPTSPPQKKVAMLNIFHNFENLKILKYLRKFLNVLKFMYFPKSVNISEILQKFTECSQCFK